MGDSPVAQSSRERGFRPALWATLLISGAGGGALSAAITELVLTHGSQSSGLFPREFVIAFLAFAGLVGGSIAAGLAIAFRALAMWRTKSRVVQLVAVGIGSALGGLLTLLILSGGVPQPAVDYLGAALVAGVPLTIVAAGWLAVSRRWVHRLDGVKKV